MTPPENIEESIKKLRCTTTAKTDDRILADAFAALQESTQDQKHAGRANIWKRIPQSSIAKSAVAVVIIAVVWLGIRILTTPKGQTLEKPAPKVQIPQKTVEQINPRIKTATHIEPSATAEFEREQAKRKLTTEIGEIVDMFVAADVQGLRAMLETGEFESKVLAATCLAKIGDTQALPALKKLYLATKDNLPKGYKKNPFREAIKTIESQLEKTKVSTSLTVQDKIKSLESNFAPRGVLSGLIFDAETAQPVEDAQVRISMDQVYHSLTDANGVYHFDNIEQDGNYRVSIWSLEYVGIYDGAEPATVVNLSRDSQLVKHFQLKPACMIDIQVVNEQDEPLEKVRLVAGSPTDELYKDIGKPAYTNANGMTTLGGLEPSDKPYLITAMPEAFQAPSQTETYTTQTTADYAPAELIVTLNNPQIIEFGKIVLKRGLPVKGYAEYSDGAPAGPKWWHSNYRPQGCFVDPNGYFTLEHIVPGTYNIRLSTRIGRDTWIDLYNFQAQLPPAEGRLLVTLPRKSPENSVSISGTITFPGDKKPDHLEVTAYSDTSGPHYANLNFDMGAFTIDSLEPGLYTLQFKGSDIEEKTIENVEAPSSGLEVELKYSPEPNLLGSHKSRYDR